MLLLSSSGYASKQKELARRLIQNYVISQNATNIALVTYGPVYTSLQLSKGILQTTVLDALQQMVIKDGSADGGVNRALDYLLTSVFTSGQGARPGVPKQSIFFVDNVDFPDSVGVSRKIEKLKSLGINTLFIKVGDDDGVSKKPTTTRDPDFANVFFFPDDLESLDQIINPIVYATGQGMVYNLKSVQKKIVFDKEFNNEISKHRNSAVSFLQIRNIKKSLLIYIHVFGNERGLE